MKYLAEYRNPELVKQLVAELNSLDIPVCTLMEICGGQTHSLVRNGILDMLPPAITMVHGPGCPVCVTPVSVIDEAIFLAEQPGNILCSFGDMLRVPGSAKSLLQAKAEGADVRILYSPLEAVQLAAQHPGKQVIFFAVGFETTAPANALSVIQADHMNLQNYSILASHVLVPPAMEAILGDPENRIDGFLAAGHVCSIMGMDAYYPIAEKYQVPVVVTGFEPVDLLQGILMVVQQLIRGEHKVENQYARAVQRQGNRAAQEAIAEVFSVSDRCWRGIGAIANSGYEVNERYRNYNARLKFELPLSTAPENNECISGEIMKGLKKPLQCPQFGKKCRPENPLGAPMVSSEGACAAYFHYSADALTNTT
ncbi:MAG TPA: hydrogenase formation protein HypD [Chitinophagaceae bacterium]